MSYSDVIKLNYSLSGENNVYNVFSKVSRTLWFCIFKTLLLIIYRLGEELNGIYEDKIDNETLAFEDEGIWNQFILFVYFDGSHNTTSPPPNVPGLGIILFISPITKDCKANFGLGRGEGQLLISFR